MKEWEKQFDTLSLSKGKRLWSEGKVEDLKKSDHEITASFSGIKRYNVTISLRNGIPARMKCQCPKAKGGSKCEHMVAALYEALGTEEERREEQGKQEPGDSKYNTIREKALQAARERAQKERETQERMKRERAAQEQAATEEAKRKAAEKAKRKVREEAERRIAERAAEKAAKKAERKRKRQEVQLAAEVAARKAAEEKALKEKQQQEELARKAAEAEERRNAEEAARKMAAEEREKKRVKKVQAAIARTKGEELKQEEREKGYCYFDLDSIRSSLQFTKNNLTNGRKLSQSGKIQLERFSTGYMSDEEEPLAEVVGTGEEGRRKFNIRMIISRTGVRSRECGCMECMRSYRWFQSNYGCDYTAGLINQAENYLEKYQVGDATDKTGSLIMRRFNGIRARQVVADVRQDEASLGLIPRMIKQEDKLALSFKIGSGKMFVVKNLYDLCEHVDNSETAVYGSATEINHQVFSQFTTMLDILAQELDALKIDYYMITGATAKKKRLQMVNAFNTDSTPVFLISLKAGGVGLNLIGADVVIHYDPWWNIAAQNQATDRAHRIGQTKKVVVYKMIVKSSIEEKIQKLQETKKDLADQIVNTETGQFSGMSREELLELLEV